MACLTVLDGAHKGHRFALDNPTTRIGRREGNDWVLDDASISGTHCEIEKSDEGFLIRDLGSTNGTSVNGTPVRERRLCRNDVILLGEVPVEIEGIDVPLSADPAISDTQTIPRTTIVINPRKRTIDTPDAFGRKSRSTKIWVAVIAALVLVIAILVAKLFFTGTTL